jgi:hypothetical protein
MIIAFSNVAYWKLRDNHFTCINPESYKTFLNFEVKLCDVSLITNECDRTIDRYNNSPFFSKDLTHIIFYILMVPIICSIACGIVPIYIIKNQTICGPSCWFQVIFSDNNSPMSSNARICYILEFNLKADLLSRLYLHLRNPIPLLTSTRSNS